MHAQCINVVRFLSAVMRRRHYSHKTEAAYLYWTRRFILFHGKRHPSSLGPSEPTPFLSHSARVDRVAASTRNQALAAILFLYRDTLDEPLPWLGEIEKARRPARPPLVFTEADLREVFGRADLPSALVRKYPNAETEWGWQCVFPSRKRSPDRLTGVVRRFHTADSVMQKAMREAVRKAGVLKAGSCHTLRHSFATHLLSAGYDIRTNQELMGHKEVTSTIIYTHVLNRGGRGVRSPADWVFVRLSV